MKKKREIISDELVKELASEFTRSGKLTGEGGLFTPLLKRVIEASLEAEVEEHVRNTRQQGNKRNGYGTKQLKTSMGPIDLQPPRDRQGSFDPQGLPKRSSSVTNEFEQKVIGLYARGMSYRDIQSELYELYGTEVSTGVLAAITDKIWPEIEQWRKRPLETVYPIIWLDAMFFKVRDEGQSVTTKAVYSILGVNTNGQKEILGFYISPKESAAFWRGVLAELNERGVEDILIACVDGLKGFPEAIEDQFPNTEVQLCVVHQIRNTIKYLAYKDVRPFLKDLKSVYTADNEQLAMINLEQISQKWGPKYQRPLAGWYNNFEQLMAFLKYPKELRRVIYTTNPIESFHRQVRKITKTKGAYPSEKAIYKQVYLVCINANNKWKGTIFQWANVRLALAEAFENRFNNHDTLY